MAGWLVEHPYALEINLNNEKVFLRADSMIAYYGQIKFARSSGGGMGRLVKRMAGT